MIDRHHRFESLHRSADLLVLPTVWDAGSARLAEECGAQALGTSSAAMAWSCGHADACVLPEDALLERVRQILRVTTLPLTVDIENGYSDDPQQVAARVLRLADLGVVGINIEDGEGSVELLAAKIAAVRCALAGRPLFINARTDVYLRGLAEGAQAVALSVQRLQAYAQAGADGGFVPGLQALAEVADVAAQVALPLNLMALPGMAPADHLRQAGVRRLSAGPALFLQAWAATAAATRTLLQSGALVGAAAASYPDVDRRFAITDRRQAQ
ncbi:isocitrate lyase/phosphoenolpyruvate mutase family protein [Stenotrophomonas sp. ZAC14D2_NAIMI4_6]|uniref:isocitrate lyase/PEP mutase family protein n=1 Tax=Stenotrophomonas sp. ZAC14D2_NAIMI4_6 TaxID=2072406 RepID=UPI000D5414CF|nr:isocitrate lyase/phosphoenolpyruvate mutase family protein [Stenotrophomonas sp. ZAC14D2_NAIMI4_6]AWH20562.1 isocitrate lyase/phosphoenolpyruvate mutase family protein [Stenotrophomonas sp. ZAC14D2_NAIMI4_6]